MGPLQVARMRNPHLFRRWISVSFLCIFTWLGGCFAGKAATIGSVMEGSSVSDTVTSVILKLPIEDNRLTWHFQSDDWASDIELGLRSQGGEKTVECMIVTNNHLCEGWTLEDRKVGRLSAKTAYFMGSIPGVLQGSRITVELFARTNLWGRSSMIEGFLPAGRYSASMVVRDGIPATEGVMPPTRSAVMLTTWEQPWPMTVTRLSSRPATTKLSAWERFALAAKGEHDYLILCEPERWQTRLYRVAPQYADWLRMEGKSLVDVLKAQLEARGVLFSEGATIFAGKEDFTIVIRNKLRYFDLVYEFSDVNGNNMFGLYHSNGWEADRGKP